MSEKSQEPVVYTIHKAGDAPVRVVDDRHKPGLSRAFYVTPAPDPEMSGIHAIDNHNGTKTRKITGGDAMTFEVSVEGQNVDALERLNQTIDHIGLLLNAAVDSSYIDILYPESE